MTFTFLPFGYPYLQGDASGDAFGDVLAAADLDGDGVSELIVGAPGADDSGTDAGTVYVFASDDGTIGSTASATLAVCAAGDACGSALFAPGDLDGDGYDDLLFGAPGDDTAATDAGAVWLVTGSSEGAGTPARIVTGDAATDALGSAIAAGDFNADGAIDLGVSAPGADGSGSDRGAVSILLGQGEDWETAATWYGDADDDRFGTRLASAGDVDGDGDDEVLVGAENAGGGAYPPGAAYVFAGDPDTWPTTAAWSFSVGTAGTGWGTGTAITAGDYNGDGYSDVAIASLVADPDQIAVFDGSASGLGTSPSYELGEYADEGEAVVASVGDVDGDGVEDLGYSIYRWDSADCACSSSQRTALLLGSSMGFTVGFSPTMEQSSAIVGLGDLNGDGAAELAFGRTDGAGAVSVRLSATDDDDDGWYADFGGAWADCDDTDDTVGFGATETAGDGVDSNCDGEDDPLASTHLTTCAQFTTLPEARLWADDPDAVGMDVEALVAELWDPLEACAAEEWASINTDCGQTGSLWATCPGTDGLARRQSETRTTFSGWDYDCDSSETGSVDAWLLVEDQSPTASGLTGAYLAGDDGSAGGAVRWTGTLDWSDGTRSTVDLTANYSRSTCDDWSTSPQYSRTLVVDGCLSDYAQTSRCGESSWILDDGTHHAEVTPLGELDCGGVPRTSEYGWGELDGLGRVVGMDTWEDAPLVDADGDGWPAEMGDCDDTDPTVHPCAEELSDPIDQDCDGRADRDSDGDGVEDWADCAPDDPSWGELERVWVDADGDGYGDPATAIEVCSTLGYVLNDADCDDTDASVHPYAAERCNARDDDCDGQIDEEAVDGVASWLDADGDGWGDPDLPCAVTCDPPGACVTNDGDCDDSDPAINPDAEEVPGDVVDQNCDGLDGPEQYAGEPASEDSCDGCGGGSGAFGAGSLLGMLLARRPRHR